MLSINKNNIISKVDPNSIAEESGIESGDILLKINEKEVKDVIDYLYLISDEYLEITIMKKNGDIWIIEVEKDYSEDLGISFKNPILDSTKSCKNKCIFCFIDQLPKNMRKTLYFKDDDSRLSFLQGNFVTLTNISDEEFERIIEYNISPINVSIHTTNPDLRVKMLNNKNASKILYRLKKLTSNRIIVNGQIVLCPRINDGQELDNTIKDLYKLYPNLNSLAVVPIGITKFRDGLFPIESYNKNSAKEVINQVEKWQEFLLYSMDSRFVFLADEFYIMADMKLPDYNAYEGFPQLENGVGLIRKFEHEFISYLNKFKKDERIKKKLTIVTGLSAQSFLESLVKKLKRKFPNLFINVQPILNNFFGEKITVSGLLTGTDIIEQLKNKDLGDKIILPNSMFKSNENILLDDLTDNDISKQLNTTVDICNVNGKELIDCIIKE